MVILHALKTVVRELPEDIRPFGLAPQDMMRFIHQAQALLSRDQLAYQADPTVSDPALIDGVVSGFQAVAFYRVANQIQRYGEENDLGGCSILATMLSERCKVLTGVEIHPCAQIGPGLVIDHGHGTVIGATVIAGQGLYLLHNVTLGARGVAGNPKGRRHPQIGDNVSIGANALVIGPVRIGSGVDIRAGCLIASDVPDHAKVSLQLVYQVMRVEGPTSVPADEADYPEVYGLVPVLASGSTVVRVFARNLAPTAAALVDGQGAPLDGYADLTIDAAPDMVEIEIGCRSPLAGEDERTIGLRLTLPEGSEMILSGRGLVRALRVLKSSRDDLEGSGRCQKIAR